MTRREGLQRGLTTEELAGMEKQSEGRISMLVKFNRVFPDKI